MVGTVSDFFSAEPDPRKKIRILIPGIYVRQNTIVVWGRGRLPEKEIKVGGREEKELNCIKTRKTLKNKGLISGFQLYPVTYLTMGRISSNLITGAFLLILTKPMVFTVGFLAGSYCQNILATVLW